MTPPPTATAGTAGSHRAAETGTNETVGRTPDRRRLRPRPGRRPGGAHPVRRRRLPRRRHELRDRPRGRRCRRGPARGRPAVLGSAGRRRHAPARVRASRSRPARPSSARCGSSSGSGRPGPDLPLVPMGYANQVIGGGDGEAVAQAAGRCRGGRPDRGRPDARRGRPVRGRRPRRRAGRRLPRGPDDAARPARRGRRPERRLPVLRLARRRDRRPDVAAGDGRTPRPRRQGRVARPGRRRLRGQHSRPTSGRSPGPARTASSSASALVDALGPDGRDIAGLGRLVGRLRAATASARQRRDEHVRRAGARLGHARAPGARGGRRRGHPGERRRWRRRPARSTSGPGTGLLGIALAGDVGEMVLAEPSAGMHEVIAEKLAAGGPANVTAVRFDLLADPPPGEPFDLAVSLLVLHHLADHGCRPGGDRPAPASGRPHRPRRPRHRGRHVPRRRRRGHLPPRVRPRRARRARAGRRLCRRRVPDRDRDRGRRPPLPALPAPRPPRADRCPATDTAQRVGVSLETSPKKAFATADRLARLVALGQDRGARARRRSRRTRLGTPSSRPRPASRSIPVDYDVVERTDGGGGTDVRRPVRDHRRSIAGR